MKQALKKLKSILGNRFWLSGGQVLGSVRDGKFLNDEHDIDLGIHQKDLFFILDRLKREKIDISIRRIDGTDIIRAIKFCHGNIDVDVFVFIPIRDRVYAVTHDEKVGHAFHSYPKELFDNLETLKVYEVNYNVPNPEEYLKLEYGRWRRPKKKWSCCINPPCLAKKVYLGGVFDLFHKGHLRLLKRARKYGEILYVSVLTDKAAKRWKRKPIIPYGQRVEIVREFADIVIPQFDVDETKDGYIDKINPDVIVHGDDKLPNSYSWAIIHKKQTVQVPYTKGVSTTKIIERIQRGSP